MKQRVISALIGLVLLAIVLAFYSTVVPNIALSLVACMAVGELLHACGYLKDRVLCGICLAFTALIPLFKVSWIERFLPHICLLFILALLILLIKQHDTLRLEEVGVCFFVTLIIPFSLATLLYTRDLARDSAVGALYLLLTLAGAWLTDTGAFFVGSAFGKHKLAPKISPKKTIEGAIGGVVFDLIFLLLIAWGYSTIAREYFSVQITVDYVALAVLAPITSVAAMLGDLSASVIKRQYGIKDFGSIMPGHGGVMDRFDSVLVVAPVVYIFISHWTILS